MPFTLNGIGTWYYGKKRIHTLKGTCQFCGKQTDLESYDTTLFFVVLFLPVIPLAQKRILEQCSRCRKHRVISAREWEKAKERDFAEMQELLSRDPNNRDAILRALVLPIAYQDEPLLNDIVDSLAGKWSRDTAVQARLGDAHAFFAHWPSAEEAYRASLAAEDNDFIREQLAWALLKQDRPDEARPYLQHIIDRKNRDSAGTVYYLVQGYQAQGRHDEALEIMDERDQAFPDWAALKDYQRQRKASTRYRGTSKKIASQMLSEGKTGYREGSWTARLPRWIAAFLLIGCLSLYIGSAVWIEHARKVYFVNGTNREYTVVVQGAARTLRPHFATPIRVAEGDVEVAFNDAKLGLEPLHVHIETPFWSRPFVGHTFVINPDLTAIVLEEERFYAAHPRMAGPEVIHFGHDFYSMAGIDHEFEAFPPSIQAQQGSEVRKTRVSLASGWAPEVSLGLLLKLSPQEQIKCCQTVLCLDPTNTMFLYGLANRLSPEEMIKFVETRFDDQPILVEWHRMYQSVMERAHPETDLRPRYRKLLADNQGNADALYLLGRADPDPEEGDKLFKQAAAANPPSGYAFNALGYHALCEARFAEAASLFDKALPHLTEKLIFQHLRYDALQASGAYDQLLQALFADSQLPGRQATASVQMMRIYAIRGDKVKAREQLAAAVQLYQPQEQQLAQKALESVLSCCEKDTAGFLKWAGDTPSFEAAFLRGQFKEAGDLVNSSKQDKSAFHGLVYLAAAGSGAKELAETHWSALLAELNKGGRPERHFAEILAGKGQPAGSVQRLDIEPQSMRVLLAVMAQRYPDQAMELLALAKRLDYQHDAISLCLAKFLQGP